MLYRFKKAKGKRKGIESLLEEIMGENFPNLGEEWPFGYKKPSGIQLGRTKRNPHQNTL